MKFFLLLGMAGALFAQNPPAPDCFVPLNRTTAGASAVFDNRFIGCVTWTLVYQSSGFSGLTLTFQSATGAVTVGTFGTYTGTITGTPAGINPNTSTTGAVTQFSNTNISTPWVRMNLSGLTGSGTVNGVLYGYKTGYSAGNGGGSGSFCGTNPGADDQIMFVLSGLCDSSPHFIENVSALPVPSAPSLATAGTAGATTWGYKIVGRNLIGGSAPSTEATIATGNATLSAMNFINVTVPACPDARVTSYDVYRTTAGGTPSATGMIAANVACSSVTADQALAVIQPFSGNPPSVDYSQGVGSDLPYVNTSSGSAFGCAAFANSDSIFRPSENATGLAVLAKTSCPTYDYNTFLSYTIVDNGAQPYPTILASDIRAGGTGTIYNVRSELLLHNGAAMGSLWNLNLMSQMTGGGTATATDIAGAVFSSTLGGVTVSGDIIGYWANVPTSATSIGGKVAAFLNNNFSGCGATGGCFGWYGQGGTWHQETGATTAVGFEIERASMQTADLQRFIDSDGSTVLSRFDKNGSLQLLSDTASPFIIGKMTASAVAPGAGKADLRWLAGTNANTCKLVANAGTSATEVTIVDNVGAGC